MLNIDIVLSANLVFSLATLVWSGYNAKLVAKNLILIVRSELISAHRSVSRNLFLVNQFAAEESADPNEYKNANMAAITRFPNDVRNLVFSTLLFVVSIAIMITI